ncbi:MAG: hypothetical protein AAGJ31_10005, partial [Verrucomicrobiota bacterium]
LTHLQRKPYNAQEFGGLPDIATDSKNFTALKDDFIDWIYHQQRLDVWQAPVFDMYSNPGETEAEFRTRLRHAEHELRDQAIKELEEQYQKKIIDIEEDLEKAMYKIQEQQAQANAAKASAMMSIGSSILSGLFGGGRSGLFSSTRARTYTSSSSRAWKEGRDVARAKEQAQELERDLQELDKERLEAKETVRSQFDAATTPLEVEPIAPLKKNIHLRAVGLAWLPFLKRGDYELEEAWM